MARSLLGAFVGGTRQVLVAQLFISIAAVGLAGWTLAVTNDLIRERERLRERVIQLEQTIANTGAVVPGPVTTVQPTTPAPSDAAYPGQISPRAEVVTPESEPADGPEPAVTPDSSRPQTPLETDATSAPSPGTNSQNPSAESVLGQIITDLFTPPPPVGTVVLHARSENDAAYARRLAATLTQSSNVRYIIEVMAPRDPRQSGYAYYDGRQSRSASALVQQFHDAARRQEIAAWSAQLRGTALPAQGQYTPDRVDIVLPPLPVPQPPRDMSIDPRILRETPSISRQTETTRPPPVR
ncbi:MAG: hypothetical protein JNK94_05005 [Hyphomonadaceae bacterium]|nr:hypothetical protein [Hyphomonadaceae bacterium]MBX3511023.1 hypothetical protein [Hyphomonadaceae bacterium]